MRSVSRKGSFAFWSLESSSRQLSFTSPLPHTLDLLDDRLIEDVFSDPLNARFALADEVDDADDSGPRVLIALADLKLNRRLGGQEVCRINRTDRHESRPAQDGPCSCKTSFHTGTFRLSNPMAFQFGYALLYGLPSERRPTMASPIPLPIRYKVSQLRFQ